MKIELNDNKVYFINGNIKSEIHPFWLRERVDGEEFLDKKTQQRLFDPTSLNSEIKINKASINNNFLEINFNDGVNSKLDIKKLTLEFSNKDILLKTINKNFLEINFNDGVNSKLDIKKHTLEFSNKDILLKTIQKIKWDSTLKDIKNFEYKKNFFESREMYDLLISFYKYGFVIIKNVPTDNNFIVKFANSIGSVRRTNFGDTLM